MANHLLKTWPEPFQALWDGHKTFEIRTDDRGYAIGDMLALQEWFPDTENWGERIVRAEVSYILDGGFGLQNGYVALALKNQANHYYKEDEVDHNISF